MKIAVTGGAGFIGSTIVDSYINLGHEVVILDNLSTGKLENINPKAKFIKIDINDNEIHDLFLNEKFDLVSHQAAQMDVRFSVSNPQFDAKNNIVGSINLFEAAKNSNVKKIVFASSGGTIYGEQSYFPADEEHPTNPCSPYGITKLSCEKYLYYYEQVYGMKYISFRYGNVYGPRQNPKGEAGVVAIFAGKMVDGEQAIINGDGKITRDYIYIDDIVSANILALDENLSGIFNVGTGIEHDTNFIFRNLRDFIDKNCKEFHGPAKAGEQMRSVISFQKLNKIAGWSPKVKFEEGLIETAKYYLNRKNE